jgi:hypothetical protein
MKPIVPTPVDFSGETYVLGSERARFCLDSVVQGDKFVGFLGKLFSDGLDLFVGRSQQRCVGLHDKGRHRSR